MLIKNFGQFFFGCFLDGCFLDQSYIADFRQAKDFADFTQVKADFEKVNKILVPLPTLNKSNFRQKSSNFTDFKQDSQSGCLWLPTPHCAAPV